MAERARLTLKGPGTPVVGRVGGTKAGSRAKISLARWAVPEKVKELAAIVAYSNDAVFSRHLNGTVATWNAAAERIFGFKAKEIIGRSSHVLLPSGHRDEFRNLVRRMRQGRVVRHFETERLRKDRRRIFVSLTLSPIRGEKGGLIGFSTIARDITARRVAQEALQRSERALADLFEQASLGLAWTTANGRVLRANVALLETLECKRHECVGYFLSRFHPDRAFVSALAKRLAGRETVRNLQTAFRTRAGDLKDVLIDASAFWDEGKLIHLRWFVRDITRRKQLERELLAISERERAAFSRELHDSLGQQLSGVAYLTNVLRERLREEGSAEAGGAGRISQLLRQALDQARAVARGLSPVRPEPDGLSTALNELAVRSSELFGITCAFNCPRPVMLADAESANHLYRIAQEAVHNAFRHGRATRIAIGLRRDRRGIRLRIVDNGRGIGALSPRRNGLGLRIMRYRAGLLQGTVSVRRRTEGGTEVCCLAPASLSRPKPQGSSRVA